MNRYKNLKFSKCINVIVTILIVISAITLSAGSAILFIEDFEKGLSSGWREKVFKGKTLYRIVRDENSHVLRAEANGTASGLIYEIEYNLKDYPVLSWRWKVEGVLSKGDARKKETDDYPARIYVIFPHWFPPKTKSINYIWANRLPKGSVIPNSYYSKAIMIAVESGPERAGRWITEQRNVYEDYKRAFGEEPPEVGAIAIMTDTDQTGEHAVAYYDDIMIKRSTTSVPATFVHPPEHPQENTSP